MDADDTLTFGELWQVIDDLEKLRDKANSEWNDAADYLQSGNARPKRLYEDKLLENKTVYMTLDSCISTLKFIEKERDEAVAVLELQDALVKKLLAKPAVIYKQQMSAKEYFDFDIDLATVATELNIQVTCMHDGKDMVLWGRAEAFDKL